ncbi:MAG: hypothetical protein ACLQF0_08695 [Dissulfurispiraceae bacterium]
MCFLDYDDKDCNRKNLISKYDKVKIKYEKIWKYYDTEMPKCIDDCKNKINKENIDGPQGIYWIGEKSKIFFVGLENDGWPSVSDKYQPENVKYAPLHFLYFRGAWMSGIWRRIRYIIEKSGFVVPGEEEWSNIIDYFAFSNLCKCCDKNNSKNKQEKLYCNCFGHGFIHKEIEAVDAPINVFFTLGHPEFFNTFMGEASERLCDDKILKCIKSDKIFYCLHHPARMSDEILDCLCADINVEMGRKDIVGIGKIV